MLFLFVAIKKIILFTIIFAMFLYFFFERISVEEKKEVVQTHPSHLVDAQSADFLLYFFFKKNIFYNSACMRFDRSEANYFD